MTDTNSIGTIPGEATTGSSIGAGTVHAGSGPIGFLDEVRARLAAHTFALVVTLAVAAVVAGQLVEDLADGSTLELLTPDLSVKRWTVIAVVVYMLFIVEVVRREARGALSALRPVVQVDDEKFQAYTERMSGRNTRLELMRLLLSRLIVTLLFAVVRRALPTTGFPGTNDPLFLPDSAPAAFVVLAGYAVVGWAGLRLVSSTIRLARALARSRSCQPTCSRPP